MCKTNSLCNVASSARWGREGKRVRAGGRRNAYACDTHRIRMDMHNNKGGDGIDYGGRGRERAVWRIIAAAAISANLIHQGKKQLRIIIDRLMEAGREGVMAEFI